MNRLVLQVRNYSRPGVHWDDFVDSNAVEEPHRSEMIRHWRTKWGHTPDGWRIVERSESVVFDPEEAREKAEQQPELKGVAA